MRNGDVHNFHYTPYLPTNECVYILLLFVGRKAMEINMDYNLHTHTVRCSHAEGTEREYIEKAISKGIKLMGFSDHFPWKNNDGTEHFYRVPMALAEEYIETIKSLREEYKEKIEILIGFEIEYIPGKFDDMIQYARDLGCEYLLLGQHFVFADEDQLWSSFETDELRALKEYVDCVAQGIKSGVITYVAHPDVINFVGDEDVYLEEMRRLCETAKEYNMPLEINFVGVRLKRHYPNERFWKIAAEVGCDVVMGFDAHDVEAAGDLDSVEIAMQMVKKYNLNLLTRPTIKRI